MDPLGQVEFDYLFYLCYLLYVFLTNTMHHEGYQIPLRCNLPLLPHESLLDICHMSVLY